MTCRAYTPDDFPTVEQWAAARRRHLGRVIFGERGFIVEDEHGPAAVAMVYLMFDVPVAVVDNFFSRPGLGHKIKRAWRILWRVICDYLRNLKTPDGQPLGYHFVRTFARVKLARLADKVEDWNIDSAELKCIQTRIPHE